MTEFTPSSFLKTYRLFSPSSKRRCATSDSVVLAKTAGTRPGRSRGVRGPTSRPSVQRINTCRMSSTRGEGTVATMSTAGRQESVTGIWPCDESVARTCSKTARSVITSNRSSLRASDGKPSAYEPELPRCRRSRATGPGPRRGDPIRISREQRAVIATHVEHAGLSPARTAHLSKPKRPDTGPPTQRRALDGRERVSHPIVDGGRSRREGCSGRTR